MVVETTQECKYNGIFSLTIIFFLLLYSDEIAFILADFLTKLRLQDKTFIWTRQRIMNLPIITTCWKLPTDSPRCEVQAYNSLRLKQTIPPEKIGIRGVEASNHTYLSVNARMSFLVSRLKKLHKHISSLFLRYETWALPFPLAQASGINNENMRHFYKAQNK